MIMIGNMLFLSSPMYVADKFDDLFDTVGVTIPSLPLREDYPLISGGMTCSKYSPSCDVVKRYGGMMRFVRVPTCCDKVTPANKLTVVKNTFNSIKCLIQDVAKYDFAYKNEIIESMGLIANAVEKSDDLLAVKSGDLYEAVDALLGLARYRHAAVFTRLYLSIQSLESGAKDILRYGLWGVQAVATYSKKPGVYFLEVTLVDETDSISMRSYADLFFGTLIINRYSGIESMPKTDIFDSIVGGCNELVVAKILAGHKYNTIYLSSEQLKCLANTI